MSDSEPLVFTKASFSRSLVHSLGADDAFSDKQNQDISTFLGLT